MNENKKVIETIFEMTTIAVVGMSPKPERPSHFVSLYMSQNGYNIIPVNPGHNSILGITSFSSLLDIEEKVDKILGGNLSGGSNFNGGSNVSNGISNGINNIETSAMPSTSGETPPF